MTTKYLTCDCCDGGQMTVGVRGANDPDTMKVTCPVCNGSDTMYCRSCDAPASVKHPFDGKLVPLCTLCLGEWKADEAAAA